FMYLLLGLRHCEKIGIEIKDDIHVELQEDKLILIQTKHTVQTKKDNSAINLTERDKDLWKTLSNWSKVIKQNAAPDRFVKNTKFQLISNKSIYKNPFIVNVQKLANNDIQLKEFKDYLKNLINTSTDVGISAYIGDLNSLENNLLKQFIRNIDFKLNEDNIIEKIKERLIENFIDPNRVDDVFNNLFSELKSKEYLDVKT